MSPAPATCLPLPPRPGLERIVYTSSVCTLGLSHDGTPADEDSQARLADQVCDYKRSKVLAEHEVRRFVDDERLPIVIVHPSTPVGRGDIKPTPTGRMIREAALGRIPAYVDTGLNIVHVDDVAAGHLLAFDKGAIGERYILGGTNLKLAEVLAIIADLTGRRPPTIRLPRNLVLPIAYVSELWAGMVTGREPLTTVAGVRMARHCMFYSSPMFVRHGSFCLSTERVSNGGATGFATRLHTWLLILGSGGLVALICVDPVRHRRIVWAAVLTGVGLWSAGQVSPKLVLGLYRARRLSPYDLPELHQIVRQLAARADLPAMPQLYYVPSRVMNAFAVGRPEDSAIAVTDGLLRGLTPSPARRRSRPRGEPHPQWRPEGDGAGRRSHPAHQPHVDGRAGGGSGFVAAGDAGGGHAGAMAGHRAAHLCPHHRRADAARPVAGPRIRRRSRRRRPDRRSARPGIGAAHPGAPPGPAVGGTVSARQPAARPLAAAQPSQNRGPHRAPHEPDAGAPSPAITVPASLGRACRTMRRRCAPRIHWHRMGTWY
jgi:hypothetical protein